MNKLDYRYLRLRLETQLSQDKPLEKQTFIDALSTLLLCIELKEKGNDFAIKSYPKILIRYRDLCKHFGIQAEI